MSARRSSYDTDAWLRCVRSSFGLQERFWTSGTVREPSIRAVAVLSLGRADETISDQRQSLSCRRTGLAPSGWIGGKVGRLITGLERDDEDVVLSFVSVAFTGEAVPIEGKVAMTAAFVGLWAAVAGIVRVLFVVGLLRRRVWAGGFRPPRLGGRRVRRVGAMGSPLVGLHASPAS